MLAKYIAFDLDGTLFTAEHLLEDVYRDAVLDVSRKHNLAITPPKISQIRQYIGLPGSQILFNLFPSLSEELRRQIGRKVLESLVDLIKAGKGKLFDNAIETLKTLKNCGYSLLIASSGRRPYVEAVVKTYGIDKYVLPLVAINDEPYIKTKSDILRHYIKLYNIAYKNFFLVGDRISDYNAAVQAGINFVGVCITDISKRELNSFDCVTSLPSLAGIFCR